MIRGSLPALSNILALLAQPIRVPSVSKISTNRNARMITIKSVIFTAPKSALKHCPKVRPREVTLKLLQEGSRE